MSAATNLTLRPLGEEDRPAWEPHWQGYLTFYKTSVPQETTDTTWSRLLDPTEPMHVLGAFGPGADGREALLGIVHYIFHRSTWTPGNYCYLQDLFTAPEARGKGVGRALIEAVYAKAREAGASRVYWLTQTATRPRAPSTTGSPTIRASRSTASRCERARPGQAPSASTTPSRPAMARSRCSAS